MRAEIIIIIGARPGQNQDYQPHPPVTLRLSGRGGLGHLKTRHGLLHVMPVQRVGFFQIHNLLAFALAEED
jgi:hypothetical protein